MEDRWNEAIAGERYELKSRDGRNDTSAEASDAETEETKTIPARAQRWKK